MGQAQNNTFKGTSDGTGDLANAGLQWIDIYHIPTGYAVNFKAMITDFTDAFATEWNSETVFGRMDPLQTFQRTGRTINIGFSVVASSVEEAVNNLARISTLVQFLYPSYDGAGVIKNSPFCKVQFLNWAASTKSGKISVAKNSGILGAISGLEFSPDMDAGTFVGLDKKLYPKLLTISFTLNVLHDHMLGWVGNKQRSSKGALFPYMQDVTAVLRKGDTKPEFTSPKSKAQQDAVPNDAKNAATAKAITRPPGMSAEREAYLRKQGHSAARIKSGKAEQDEAEIHDRKRRIRVAKERCGNNWTNCLPPKGV